MTTENTGDCPTTAEMNSACERAFSDGVLHNDSALICAAIGVNRGKVLKHALDLRAAGATWFGAVEYGLKTYGCSERPWEVVNALADAFAVEQRTSENAASMATMHSLLTDLYRL